MNFFSGTLCVLGAFLGIAAQVSAQALAFENTRLRALGAGSNDDFGHRVGVSGTRIFVSLLQSQRVQVFQVAGGTTFEAELTSPDTLNGDWFGFSMETSGTRCIVGAPMHAVSGIKSGAAYVFAFDGLQWNLEQKLQASDKKLGDEFGWSVSISGDSVAVGSRKSDDSGAVDQGAVYIFDRSGSQWNEVAKVTGVDGVAGDWFGSAVNLENDRLACAAASATATQPFSGAVYIFERIAGVWLHDAKLVSPVSGETFGHALDLDGDRLAVGMPYGGSGGGAALIFERTAGVWDAGFTCLVTYGDVLDQLGTDVALVGDRLVAGAIFDWTWDDWSGSSYVFDKVGATWSPVLRLLPALGWAGAVFGHSVDFDGTRVVIGAPHWGGDPNAGERAYLFEGLPSAVGTASCPGDGSVTPCPCGNNSAAGLGFGCENAYSHGAHLAATGSVSLAANDLFFSAEHMTLTSAFPPIGPIAQLVMGDSLLSGVTLGDGLLCAGGSLTRVGEPVVGMSGGIAWWAPDASALGGVQAGDHRVFQVFYRDVASGGCGQNFNTSNALEITFAP